MKFDRQKRTRRLLQIGGRVPSGSAQKFCSIAFIFVVCSLGNEPTRLEAGVVVLNNRTDEQVAVAVQTSLGVDETAILLPTSSRPFFADEPPWVDYLSKGLRVHQQVELGSAYYFSKQATPSGKRIALRRIGLGNDELAQKIPPQVVQKKKTSANSGSKTIRIVAYVDDEELMIPAKWQSRLRKRIATASEIIEDHTKLPVELVGFGRWRSENRLQDFSAILAEFEKNVTPPPGTIAVGFSSQLEMYRRGKRHLGGTRGPLRSHLLVREWAPQISEVERVEVLVHELGHYFGASHSPEMISVMRPTLGGSDTRLKAKRIQFDPLNTLAIATVAEEMRSRNLKQFEAISPTNRLLLASIYATLKKSLPDDSSSAALYKRVSRSFVTKGSIRLGIDTLIRQCLSELTIVAANNRRLARRTEPIAKIDDVQFSLPQRLEKDELANLYVKTIARSVAESQSPDQQKIEALLYALPLAIDRSTSLNKFAYFRKLMASADPDRQRKLRMNVIGEPTARDRQDTLLHFAVSAALTLQEGEKEARFWGFAKEVYDSLPGGSGFSFADIAADEAGIRFALALQSGALNVEILANRFQVNNFVPSLEGLEEGLQQNDFISKYGGAEDMRYTEVLEKINRRIELLPPYFHFSTNLPNASVSPTK